MIIVSLTGGLGNQLFQHALGRRLALQHGTELLLDISGYGEQGEARPSGLAEFVRPFKLQHFRIQSRVATAAEVAALRDDFYRATTRDRLVRQLRRVWPGLLWPQSHRIERSFCFQPEALEFPDNTYLQGYWQSPRYFEEASETVRSEFRLADEAIMQSAAGKVAALRQEHGRVVSLHVRRGDLAHAHEVLNNPKLTYGAPVNPGYLQKAMKQFAPGTCFFVFSDSPKDIAWCQGNLPEANLVFSDAASDLWDFAAMTLCDGHIIANSTFSWWAAWLDPKPDKRVIAPRAWSSPEHVMQMPLDDLIPSDWTLLD